MKNIPKIIPVMYAKALKDGTLVWGEDCVSATNDFEEDGFTGVALVRLSDVDACQTNEQGRAAEGAVRPALLTEGEKKSLQKFAEDVWADLQTNELGGYSGINRPFWLAWKFTEVIEKYGYRDVGLHHSKNALDEAYQRGKNEATQPPSASPVAVPDILKRLHAVQAKYRSSLAPNKVDDEFAQIIADIATQPALPDAGLDSQRLKFLVEKADWHRKGTDGHWTIRLYNKRHTTFLQTVDAANATSKATS